MTMRTCGRVVPLGIAEVADFWRIMFIATLAAFGGQR
jgi:hypothetical protein